MSEFKFAQTLRFLKSKKGVTDEKIAEYLNCTTQAISNYRLKKTTPNYETLIKLADYFGVSCDFLLTGFEHNERKKHEQILTYIFNDAKKILSKMHTRAEGIEENLRQLEEVENELYALLFKSRNISQQLDTQEEN